MGNAEIPAFHVLSRTSVCLRAGKKITKSTAKISPTRRVLRTLRSSGDRDLCGSEVAIRKDDAPETVRHRLEVYHASTEILKDYYRKQGKLRLVEGNQSIEGANQDILCALGVKK